MDSVPRVLTIPALDAEPGLVHGFSTMALGTVGLTRAPDPAAALASRADFARSLGIDADTLTIAGAVHGAVVARADEPRGVVDGVDGLVTDRAGVALFATFADCYPIILWAPERHCAALVHAGWRGTLARVAAAGVQALRDEYRADPARIRAGIGPGICGRCYEVGDDVAARFDRRFVADAHGDRYLLDLAAANQVQLEEAGVREVHLLGLCTKESGYLPSHRRLPDGSRFGAIVAVR